MSLGIRLRKKRMVRKITQQTLADLINVKQQAIQRIEAGKVRGSTQLVAIAEHLAVSAYWLANGPDSDPILSESRGSHAVRKPFHIESTVPLLEWDEINQLSEV